MIACMGGWCALRDACENYTMAPRNAPVERLCVNGRDGLLRGYSEIDIGNDEQIVIHRRQDQWQSRGLQMARPAGPFDGLAA